MFLNSVKKYIPSHGLEDTVYEIRKMLADPYEIKSARDIAENILYKVRDRMPELEMKAIVEYVRDHFRYTGDPTGIEYIKTPSEMVSELKLMGYVVGDCDDVSVLLASILVSVDIPVRIITITTADSPTFDYNHIYIQGFDKVKGIWYNLDGTLRGKKWNDKVVHKRIKIWQI